MNLKEVLNKSYPGAAGMTGYLWLVMIVTIGVVMLIYTFYYDIVVTIFYNVALQNGMPGQKVDLFVFFYQYFPIPFFMSLICYFIVNSMVVEAF